MTRHYLITGAADGIGRALAHNAASRGAIVTGLDHDAALSARTQEELERLGADAASFVHADLLNTNDLDALADTLAQGPKVDVLIHNAGISHVGRFATSDLEAQQRVITLNLLTPMRLTAALLARDHLNEGGSVVFISSLSHFTGYPGAAVYAATKDGLASYARCLRGAVAASRIHVLTVYPGPTRTAHARRYSPDNSREDSRMSPEDLAALTFEAIDRRRNHLLPGAGPQLFARLGRVAPDLMTWIMGRIMLK